MISIKRALSIAVVSTIAACSQAPLPTPLQGGPVLSSTNVQVQGATVEVRIETGTQLKTLAAKKTSADVHHYHIKLINTATGVVMAEGDATDLVSFFQKVPNGTYKVNVDALDATGNSIVQGGAQDSSNTVTVASPNVTYSDGGPCLKVRLKLLNATGEKVGNNIIVADGDEWSGTPELQPGGNCPCPSPSPSPSAAMGLPRFYISSDMQLIGNALSPYVENNLGWYNNWAFTEALNPGVNPSFSFKLYDRKPVVAGFSDEALTANGYVSANYYSVEFDGATKTLPHTFGVIDQGARVVTGTYDYSDVFTVRINAGAYQVLKNGTVIHTSSQPVPPSLGFLFNLYSGNNYYGQVTNISYTQTP